jgi:hypothetical protein
MRKLNIPKAKQIQGLRKAIANRKTPRQFIPSMKKRLAKLTGAAAILFALLGCAARPAIAQAPVTIQPTQQTLASTALANNTCTGSAQTFPVNNKNQTQHSASIAASGTTTSLQFIIQGVDNAGNVFNISDVGQVNGSISGSGYFPTVQVQVTCLPNTATFTLSYSASGSGTPVTAGSYFTSQVDKLIFQNASAASNQSLGPFTPPFGNTFGVISFRNTSQSATNQFLTVSCTGNIIAPSTLISYQYPLTASTDLQSFSIPAFECPQMTVGYNDGGSGASTFVLEYVFDQPGNLASKDPCATQKKTLKPINLTASAQVITGAINNYVYICSLQLIPAASDNVALVEGTGAVCVTLPVGMAGGATAATGWNLTANENLPMGSGFGTVYKSSLFGNNVCLLVSAATQLSGAISYVIAP